MNEICEQHQMIKIQTAIFPICILCWLRDRLAGVMIHDLYQITNDWIELIFLPRYSPTGQPWPELWVKLVLPGGQALKQADAVLPYVEDCEILFDRGRASSGQIECRIRRGAYIQPVTVLMKAEQAISAVRCCFENDSVPD